MKKKKNTTTYREDLTIDPLSLDEELKWQPSLFEKWNKAYAQACYEFDRSKEALEVVYAELYEEIANDPEDFGLERYTEPAIKQNILLQPKYKIAKKRKHKARRNMQILSGAKDAMRQKKDALENLVRIFLSGYYSDPKVPHKAKEVFSKKQEERENAQLNKSKRLKKLKRKLKHGSRSN